MLNTINFCGTECVVLKKYEISEKYTKEHGLSYRNRITFITPNGDVIDCADTFEYKTVTEDQLIDIVKDTAESEEIAEAIIKTYCLENKFKELGTLDAFVDWIANY